MFLSPGSSLTGFQPKVGFFHGSWASLGSFEPGVSLKTLGAGHPQLVAARARLGAGRVRLGAGRPHLVAGRRRLGAGGWRLIVGHLQLGAARPRFGAARSR